MVEDSGTEEGTEPLGPSLAEQRRVSQQLPPPAVNFYEMKDLVPSSGPSQASLKEPNRLVPFGTLVLELANVALEGACSRARVKIGYRTCSVSRCVETRPPEDFLSRNYTLAF